MSESEARINNDQQEKDEPKQLKYLDFVQVASLYVVVYCSTIYQYAKENSGPLRPGVQTVESVIGPVYEKFHCVPFELLHFMDRKVDETLSKLDRHVPVLLKQLAGEISAAGRNAPEVARELKAELDRDGPAATATRIARTAYEKYRPEIKDLYVKYEPVAEHVAVETWRSLNRLPVFPQVANIMVPTATYWAERYNQAVGYAAKRGYAVSYYLPLVPIERIAKNFEGGEPAVLANGEYGAVSQ